MDKSAMIDRIKQTAASVLPKGSTLYLYGSRARGDYHEDSDWDLLLLLDKEELKRQDGDQAENERSGRHGPPGRRRGPGDSAAPEDSS